MRAPIDDQQRFWVGTLSGRPRRIDLSPCDRRPPTPSFLRACRTICLGPSSLAALHTLCVSRDTRPFVTLLATLGILLSRRTGHFDLTIGSLSPDSLHQLGAGPVDLGVNPVVLRLLIDAGSSFRTALATADLCVHDASRNRDVPFPHVVESLGLEPDPGRLPLFEIMLVLLGDVGVGESVVRRDHFDALRHYRARCDMVWLFEQREEGLRLELEYDELLLPADTVEELIGQLRHLLIGAARDVDGRVDSLPLEDPDEAPSVAEFNAD